MHRGLYEPIDKLLEKANCTCRERTLYAYERALKNTGAWPLETAFLKLSVSAIFDKLSGFPGRGTNTPQMCNRCSINFKRVVSKAVEVTKDYFDGLCLGRHLYPNFELQTEID